MTVQQEKLLGEKTLKMQQMEQDLDAVRKTLTVREEEVRCVCVCVYVCMYVCMYAHKCTMCINVKYENKQ